MRIILVFQRDTAASFVSQQGDASSDLRRSAWGLVALHGHCGYADLLPELADWGWEVCGFVSHPHDYLTFHGPGACRGSNGDEMMRESYCDGIHLRS